MLRAFVNCAKTVLSALTSAQLCYQKSINRRIYDCNSKTLKGFQRMGGGLIYLKTFRASLMMTYRI
jgi:hypothetical protein